MRNRKKRSEIEEQLRKNIKHQHVYQKQPYTMVRLSAEYNGVRFEDFGFSKVCWPDKFDPDRGVELCVDKIIAEWSKEIYDASLEKVAA